MLTAPFINAIFGFYHWTGSLGWSVIIVTVLIRLLLLPLVWPSLKSAEKMRELQPKLKKLQDKYGKDKEGLAKAQMDLYKSEGVNPMSGCLPQILQIAVLIMFFSAFNMVTMYSEGKGGFESINNQLVDGLKMEKGFLFDPWFLGSDLRLTPAKEFEAGASWGWILPAILLIGSGLLQYISAKMMMPGTEKNGSKNDQLAYVKETPGKEDDMMAAMRTQTLYVMPLMTVVIGWNFSLGILLYWFINSVVMLAQQSVMAKVGKRNS